MRSRPARVLLLAVTVAVVAGALAPAPGGSAAAAGDPCDAVQDDPAVVVTPPTDDPTGPDGAVAVYRGSEIVVHLCQEAGGARSLDASGLSWATVVDGGQERVRIRVEGSTNDSLGTLASPSSVPGPSLTIVDRTVDSTLVNGSIPVASTQQRQDLRDAEATYLERERALERQLESLTNATTTAEDGSTADGDPVADTLVAWREYRNASETLRSELYDVADSSVGGPASAAAIQSLGERSAAMENRTAEGLAEYDAALRDRQTSLTWSLRLRIVGIGLLGVLLGAAAGAVLPIRRGRAARRRLAQGEWTAYSRRAMLLPAAIGFVLLCAGLGLLVVTVGDVLLEVMLP